MDGVKVYVWFAKGAVDHRWEGVKRNRTNPGTKQPHQEVGRISYGISAGKGLSYVQIHGKFRNVTYKLLPP